MAKLTERQLEVKRKYREANREKVRHDEKLRQREKRKNFPLLYVLSNAKNRARRENLPFDINVEDLVCPDVCPILQTPLKYNFGGRCISNESPSLDKIIPELGYVKGNVRMISHRANRLKSDLSIAEINRMADYVNGKI